MHFMANRTNCIIPGMDLLLIRATELAAAAVYMDNAALQVAAFVATDITTTPATIATPHTLHQAGPALATL